MIVTLMICKLSITVIDGKVQKMRDLYQVFCNVEGVITD